MMNQRRWLWLEDQQETVLDFKAKIDSAVPVQHFTSPPAMMRYIRDLSVSDMSALQRLGLILDVMITGNPMFTVPGFWRGDTKAQHYPTGRGYDTGVVLYERLFCDKASTETGLIELPPPVIFLTVVHLNFEDLSSRFQALREQWASKHKVGVNDARVAWKRKESSIGTEIAALARAWGGTDVGL